MINFADFTLGQMMNVSAKFKLSSAAIGEINDACEVFESQWKNFDKLKSPPSIRDPIIGFRSKSIDKLGHVKHELARSLIETDLRYRKANKLAVSRKVYVDMLRLKNESVLEHFDWEYLQSENATLEPQRKPADNSDSNFGVETKTIASAETSVYAVSGETGVFKDHSWSFLDPPLQDGDIGSLGGDYRILEKIGSGGMGTVFMGEDTNLLRKVAIKVIRATNSANSEEAQQRFLREARAMAAIESDHVVPVYHVGNHNGIVFLVMPVLRGETLGSLMDREQTLPQEESVRIAKEIAIGLSHAHQLGQIHRDIKPENVWLESPNSKVKILDFGLVRTETDTFKTLEGAVVGTPRYMSPEQVRGEQVDATTDLFSLGSVLYQMLCGKPVFEGNSLHATLLAVSNCEYQSLSEQDFTIAPELAGYVDKLLSKEPRNRPPEADSVVTTLDSLIGSVSQVEVSQISINTSPKTEIGSGGNSRSKVWAAAALFGFLMLLSILVLKFRAQDGTIVVELDGDVAVEQIEIDGNQVNFERNGNSIEFTVDPGTHRLTLKTPSGDILQTNLSDEALTVYSGKNNDTIRAWFESAGEPKSNLNPETPSASVDEMTKQERELNALHWILKHEGASASVTLGGGEGIKVKSVEEIPKSPLFIYDVNLSGCDFVNEELKNLSGLGLIRSMGFWDSSLNDEGLAALTMNGQKPLLELGNISAHRCDISDRGFSLLKDSPLHYLVIPSTKIKTVTALQNKRIKHFHADVSLMRTVKEQCSEVLVGSVTFHENLTEFDSYRITPEMASWFPRVGNRGFQYRRDLSPEESLETWKNLAKVNPTQVSFVFFSGAVGEMATDLGELRLESVKRVAFSHVSGFSGTFTEFLRHFPNLESLSIGMTTLRRKDTFDGIEKLRDKLKLQEIKLKSIWHGFDQPSAQRLAIALPNCNVYWDGKLISNKQEEIEEDK